MKWRLAHVSSPTLVRHFAGMPSAPAVASVSGFSPIVNPVFPACIDAGYFLRHGGNTEMGGILQNAVATKLLLRDARRDLAKTVEALRVSEAASRSQVAQLRKVLDELSATL